MAIGQQTQGFVRSIENQTKAIQESNQNPNKNLQRSIEKGIQKYDALTTRNIQYLTNLDNFNIADSFIVKTVSNLLNDKNKSQFSLEPVEGDSNLFTINPGNPQQVRIKCSTNNF